MNSHRCCETAAGDSRSEPIAAQAKGERPRQPPFDRGFFGIAGWMIPGAILAVLPKCPACLAAYVAVWTGVGLSLPTATYLRTSLLTLCIASLLFLAVHRVGRVAVVKQVLLRAKSLRLTIGKAVR